MQVSRMFAGCLLIAVIAMAGCSQSSTNDPAGTATSSVDGSIYVLDEEPVGAADVKAARADAKDADEVVVLGKIGGSTNPWIEGNAAFTIVDLSLKSCADREGDNCPKPWDYCCESGEDLKAGTVLVKVVDDSGETVPEDARKLLPVKELSTVVVRGKAQRDDSGNLVVLASGVFVRP